MQRHDRYRVEVALASVGVEIRRSQPVLRATDADRLAHGSSSKALGSCVGVFSHYPPDEPKRCPPLIKLLVSCSPDD